MNIILENTEATFVEKKSKFIASLIKVYDEDDAIKNIDLKDAKVLTDAYCPVEYLTKWLLSLID